MNEYKQKLEEERDTLTAELSKLGKRDPATGDWEAQPEVADPNEADSNTQADRFEDFEERTALLNTLEGRLTQVAGALSRIENGTFGFCKVSGEPIEPERLGANPAAETCMKHLNA